PKAQICGGGAALIEALLKRLTALGGQVQTSTAAEEIVLRNGRVAGVRCSDGHTYTASTIVASCHPKTTLCRLVPTLVRDTLSTEQMRRFRSRGIEAVVTLGATRPVHVGGEARSSFHTADHPQALHDAIRAARCGQLADTLPVWGSLDSEHDKTLAPDGHQVISLLVTGVPQSDGQASDTELQKSVLQRCVKAIQRLDPGFGEQIVASQVYTPAIIEAEYGSTGGTVLHGEHALDQLWSHRPSLALSRHRAAIPGLYLASSGTHPGGGLTGAPGALAAQAILVDTP
ncbi:MAG: hypothetical protein GWP91_00280, partial [Rhodobacterales bacterium]|nr:hypothetical protein [Rhodobacterales bacterium]